MILISEGVMGVQDLSKELRPSDVRSSLLSSLSGKVVGLDASIWLHKSLFSSPEMTMLFHQLLPVSLAHIVDLYFDQLLALFEVNNITILFVLDGARNPLKAHTNALRQKKNSDASLEMKNHIESGDQNELKTITTLKKRGLHVREDVLDSFVRWCDVKGVRCAFMEAEWDLCRLEMDGIIDAVASNDSDCFVLGCSTVIQLFDLKISATGLNCTIVLGECLTNYMHNILPNATTGEMADFAVLLGVDYLDRAHGNSVKKVTKLFQRWRDKKEDILEAIQNRGAKSRTGIPGYLKTFRESSNIFQFAPCFVVESDSTESTVRESFWNNSYRLRRGNLRDIPLGERELDLFGFEPDSVINPDH